MSNLETLTITKSDLDADNFYIGAANVSDWSGHIEIAADLGVVNFKARLMARGRIVAEAGTGIKAGLGIEAGWGIEAGLSISCKVIASGLRIFAGLCLWRLPTAEEKKVRCERIDRGEVAFGELVIIKQADVEAKS